MWGERQTRNPMLLLRLLGIGKLQWVPKVHCGTSSPQLQKVRIRLLRHLIGFFNVFVKPEWG